MVQFEGYDRRKDKLEKELAKYGFSSLEEARDLCLSKGVDVESIVKGVQPIAFDNAVWAYTLGCAIAIKNGAKNAADAAEQIGLGLQAFCVPGSVAEDRKVGPVSYTHLPRAHASRSEDDLRIPLFYRCCLFLEPPTEGWLFPKSAFMMIRPDR